MALSPSRPPLRHLSELGQHLATLNTQTTRPRMAVVWPSDSETAKTLLHLIDTNKAEIIAVGQLHTDLHSCAPNTLTHLTAESPEEAANIAVTLIAQGQADVLMKGHINSDMILRAVLHKQHGIVSPNSLLTHVSVLDWERYHKLLFVSDVAVLPEPTLAQRRLQISYLNSTMQACALTDRKLALIHFSEQINERYPLTLDYQTLVSEAEQGAWEGLSVYGPLDIGTSVSSEAAALKDLEHPVCGQADALLMPTLETGNVFYKTATIMGGAEVAGVVLGACCPIVLNSRADHWQTKCYSLDLALLLHLYHKAHTV